MITEQQVLDGLPKKGFIRDYVATAAASTDTPLAFHLFAIMAALSPLLPRSAVIQEGFGDTRPIMWSLLVGESGSRKTVAVTLSQELLKGAGLAKFRGPQPGSYQGLMTSLNEKPTQVLVYEEFGTFLGSTYGGGAGGRMLAPLRQQFTNIFDGTPIENYTSGGKRNKRTVSVKDHRMSMLAGCTPRQLNQFTDMGDWEGGFMGRMAMCVPVVGERHFPRPPPRHPYWGELCTRLHKMAAQPIGECTGFSESAEKTFEAWLTKTKGRWEGHARASMLVSATNRTGALLRRAALIYAFDIGAARPRQGSPWKIDAKCARAACAFVEMHIMSYARIVNLLAYNQFERIQGSILLELEDGPIAWGELLRLVQPRQKSKDLRAIVDTLTETGEIVSFTSADGDTLWCTDKSQVPDDALD